jgi:hypothetical protein
MAVKKSVVTIWVRHQGDCKYANRNDRNFARDCDCVKWLRYSGDACFCGYRHKGRQHRLSTGTRSWTVAEDKRAEYQQRLDSGETGVPLPAPESHSQPTIEQQLQTYLIAKQSENISASVQRKLRYQLGLFCSFMADRSKFYSSEITPTDVIEFRASWRWSDLTKIKAQQNLRGFIKAVCRENRTDLLDALHATAFMRYSHARERADIRTLQELLDHAFLETTGIYCHVNPPRLRKAIQTCHPRQLEPKGFAKLTPGPRICSQCMNPAVEGKTYCAVHLEKQRRGGWVLLGELHRES